MPDTLNNKVLIKLHPLACSFIKKESLTQLYSCEFCEITKNTFFTEHLWTLASVTLVLWLKEVKVYVKYIFTLCETMEWKGSFSLVVLNLVKHHEMLQK